MPRSVEAAIGTLGQSLKLPSWGRAFWQDPRDGDLCVLFASGNTEVDFSYSTDSGNTWSAPQVAFYVDDFSVHDNFDTAMDDAGNIHCAHRYSTSGCYTLLAKDFSGGWTPSGIIGRGFTAVGDTGPAKGFNGSIQISNESHGFSDVAGPFPVARIAAKNSSNLVDLWFVPNTFTSFPILDSMSPVNTILPAGAAGGFPIINIAGSSDSRQVIYSIDATGIVQADNPFGSWGYRQIEVKDPSATTFNPDTLEGSGYFSRAPLGPSMSYVETNVFLGPPGSENRAEQTVVLVNSKDNELNPWDLLVSTNEQQIAAGLESTNFAVSNTFVRLPSQADYSNGINIERSNPLSIPFYDIPGNEFSRGGASGTLSDMSWRADNNAINLYFLISEPNGQQSISRAKMEAQRDFTGGTIGGVSFSPQNALYRFDSLSSPASGFRSWAPAGRDYAGGSGFFLTWNNFKALRHRAPQYSGVFKQEAVVTQGSGLDGVSRIVFWDFDESIESREPTASLTTFVQERTRDSGNNESFVGPSAAVGVTSTDLDNLFDGNTATSGAISNGDSITLEFTSAQTFNRIEVAWNDGAFFPTNSFFELTIDASQNGTTFSRVATIPARDTGFTSGETLEKYTSEYDPADPDLNGTVRGRIAPFVARYVKINFGGAPAGPEDVREIRLYGAHNTAGGYRTEVFDKEFFRPTLAIYSRVEDFTTVPEGRIPNGWTTYGDFDWFVRASGAWSNFTQDGFVSETGLFTDLSNGRSDGFAARTSLTGVPKSPTSTTSGVLEVIVNVGASEFAFDGSRGRTVEFDIRHDVVVEAPTISLSDPQDDQVIFETVSETGIQRVPYPARFPINPSEFCGTNICIDYTRYRTAIPTGQVTLRWIYQRGTKASTEPDFDRTVVWLDNVRGVGALPQASIAGFVRGRAFNTNDFTGNSGVFGFMKRRAFESGVRGYIKSDTAIISGNSNAYMLGIDFASGSVNSYLQGFVFESVAGYLNGINYNAQVNAFLANSGVSNTFNGFIKNALSGVINAFVKAPSGQAQVVNAYLLTPEVLSVNGYISGPIPITGSLAGYLKANGYQHSVNAWMIASGVPSGSINGYMLASGAFSSINAFLPRGDRHEVYAYTKGASPATGVINAWTSGVGVVNQNVNAYVLGISGVASGSFNGYMAGVLLPNNTTHGYLVGFGDDSQCNFPLVPDQVVTIPSGNFFG